MRLFIYLIASILFLNKAYAEDFYIEDPALKSLPKSIETAVRVTKTFEFAKCKLVGKAINLSENLKSSDYIVTTSQACGWGGSLGPVWVLSKLKGSYVVVFETFTYAVELNKKKSQELHQIVTTHATAGHSSYTRWVFTGKIYKEAESYEFFPDDEKLCKAHRDICPF